MALTEDSILASTFKLLATALAAAGLMTACGGGGGADTTPKAKISAVKVIGDSLSDSGTMGYKFTVQGSDAEGPYKVWPERVAGSYNLNLCNHFSTVNGQSFNVNNNCTN